MLSPHQSHFLTTSPPCCMCLQQLSRNQCSRCGTCGIYASPPANRRLENVPEVPGGSRGGAGRPQPKSPTLSRRVACATHSGHQRGVDTARSTWWTQGPGVKSKTLSPSCQRRCVGVFQQWLLTARSADPPREVSSCLGSGTRHQAQRQLEV